ncbi:hypothetical protein PR001_g21927 [Phytophthora rubi]|uniref:Uncharacterized protein n=1 Tax=Phytophthora rubi TaxID=129364 RepID=A0A6A3J0T6_9STRA|nr:hypothetical protein PR001_g21927 [Phytophthora rubi]KAE8993966.1 hypothetical protein PR002_g20076 [Phytophthora rubi]
MWRIGFVHTGFVCANIRRRKFALSRVAAERYVKNIDLWVCQKIDTLTSEKKETVVNAVAQMYLLAIQNIHALSIPTESTLPVTPKELVASSMVVLLSTIEAHHNQLTLHFGEEEINRVSKEFQLLRHEYSSKKPIQEAIDTFDHRLASFEEMWQLDDAATRFPTLAHD